MKQLISLFFAIACLISTTAHATLESRLGGQAVYDSDLNITWTANANLAATLPFGLANVLPSSDSGNQPGTMFGTSRDSWIGSLNSYQTTGYLGFNDWRLTTDNCGTVGYVCTDSEFGYLFYNELGGIAHSPISSSNSPNLALFTNIIENNFYWTRSLSGEHIKVFEFGQGARSSVFGTLAQLHVWAVRDGDSFPITSVPEPETYSLLLAGLGLLGFTSWRRKQNIAS